MKRKTAVEWLESKVLYIVPSSQKYDLLRLFEQAKQMEKEQIMDAADVCLEKSGTEPEEYYNKIYKQD